MMNGSVVRIQQFHVEHCTGCTVLGGDKVSLCGATQSHTLPAQPAQLPS
jgi:hypothetical protein